MAEINWRELVDLAALGAWMDGKGLGPGAIEDISLLKGGTQNVMLMFKRAGRGYVLRRPPPHPRANGDDTMRKEMRVLAALAGTDVPHPGLIAACPEKDVLGAAFYLMEPVDGFNATVGLPALHAGDPTVRHGMGLSLVEGAVRLGRLDHVAVGLEGLGRVEGFLERQVGRWGSQLEGYREYAGWEGPQVLPGVAKVAAWLEAHRPASFAPGLMHGDYQLFNVMFRHDGPGLAAIIDWELATIGDPLLDMGWILATWPDATADKPINPWDGFPIPAELVAHYAALSGRDLGHIDWYHVLACYKLGIILEGSNARACAGKAPRDIGDLLHASAINLFERAGRLIA